MIIKYSIYTNTFAEKKRFAKATYNFFFSKNTRELDIVLTKTVNILITNGHVKLMMF